MGTAAHRVKSRTGRAKATPVAARSAAGRAGETLEAVLGAIFDGLPEARHANGGVPEVVRKNRRERAKRRLLEAIQSRGAYAVPEARWGEVRTIAERWAQKDFDDASAEVVDFEIRCAEESAVLEAEAWGDEEARFAAAVDAYRRGVIEKHGRIEIRGLQLSARVHQDLEIAYVPLHVEMAPQSPTYGLPTVKLGSGAKESRKPDPSEAIEAEMFRSLARPRMSATQALKASPRLLLVGGPGSGKSTLAAYLATRAARGGLGAELGLDTAPLPFLVLARSLRDSPVTPASLARAAGAEPWLFDAALRRSKALLLVDGLDEARADVASEILRALTAILDAHPGTRAILTTRPGSALRSDEPAPPGFARAALAPMTREEVQECIYKWCLAAELSLGKARAHAEAEARIAADDLNDRVRARRAIEKLAETPLLCSVICVVHRFLGQQIPARRVALYEAITNVLLYEWDQAKLPKGAAIGKLDAAAKRALLAPLARFMHEAGLAELPEQEVIRRFAARLPDLGRPAEDAAAVVTEIRDRNGILVERAPGMFAFSHLTFQEYLTAMELVREHAYDRLLDDHENTWWHEVIVLAAGFPGADAARMVRGLLEKDGGKVAEGTMLAAQCLETAIELSAPVRETIKQHVAKVVPPKSRKDYDRLQALGQVAGPVLMQGLERVDTEGKVSISLALGDIAYEPAAGQLGRLMSDPSETSRSLYVSYGTRFPAGYSVAQAAAFALCSMLDGSEAVFLVASDAMPDAHPKAIQTIRNFEQHQDMSAAGRELFRALIQRYDESHPKPSSSPGRRTKRGGRSG